MAAEYDNYESIVKCELNEEEEEEEENWTDFTKKLPVTITKNKINKKPIRHKVIARPLGKSFDAIFYFFTFFTTFFI